MISRSKQIPLVGVDEGDRKEERRERKVSRLVPKWSTGLQMVNWSSNIWSNGQLVPQLFKMGTQLVNLAPNKWLPQNTQEWPLRLVTGYWFDERRYGMDGILILMFLAQVGRDEAKARMKELESELARAEQTSALREEVFNYQLPAPPQFRWLMIIM